MKTILELLSEQLSLALKKLGYLSSLPSKMALVVPSGQIDLADYQSNVAMGLAKALKQNPREIAEDIVGELNLDDFAKEVQIAGSGFINIKLEDQFILQRLKKMARDERFLIPKFKQVDTVAVDFSGPNLAKQMHVGHLRSTIIGDSIARFYEFAGYNVKRINHVGDWGTQFGMLIEYIRQYHSQQLEQKNFFISDLESFYRKAKACYDSDEGFAKKARSIVVNLQSGDKTILAIWELFCQESLKHCQRIYQKLDIRIQNCGESFYNDDLANVVDDLLSCSLAQETQGAIGVFLDGYENSEGGKIPVIVCKSDGGYLYATTDLAALRYRFSRLKVDKAIYVTDARQRIHFEQVFTIADKMKWADKKNCVHIGFGMMLDKSGKPFKTRDGGTVKLEDLIDESCQRSYQIAKELSPELSEEELKKVAFVVGIGGIKYADLVHGISTDYKFDWDKMLARDGNTASYLLINYARTRSIGRRLGIDCKDFLYNQDLSLATSQERLLALKLIQLPDVWQQVFSELAPNYLLNYLYELSRLFAGFWSACPIGNCKDEQIKQSRLALCALFGEVVNWGLGLVGIKTLEKI